MPAGSASRLALKLAAIVAVLFGIATVASGGVLFGDGAEAAGNYVPFVVWFNFLAGFAYVAAGLGLWLRRAWAPWLALALASSPRWRSPRSAGTSARAAPTRKTRWGGDAPRAVGGDCRARPSA